MEQFTEPLNLRGTDMNRQCGICKMAPREGEDMRCVRVREEDAQELQLAIIDKLDIETGAIQVGMYQAISEVVNILRDVVARRLDLNPDNITNGMLQ